MQEIKILKQYTSNLRKSTKLIMITRGTHYKNTKILSLLKSLCEILPRIRDETYKRIKCQSDAGTRAKL